jgi:hypothetical protein
MNREEDEAVASLMRSLGIGSQDEEENFPSSAIALVLMPAGPKLKAFRERSGWTAAEISERTGVPLQVLEGFEAGALVDEDVLLSALERVASACCCTLEELGLDRIDLHRPVGRSRRKRPAPLW